MGFFGRLFGLEKQNREETNPPVSPIEEKQENSGIICSACGLQITGDQKVKSWTGKKYHVKPCWRNMQKQAKGIALG